MHLNTITFLSALAATAVLANPIAIGDLSPTVENRATTTKICAGDASGNTIGVQACATVTFKDRYNIEFDLCVTDTKGDSHPVYGWLRTYGEGGYYKDLPAAEHLKNNLGHGHEVCAKNLKWDQTSGRITGVRVEGCVNDAGSDTCARGAFQTNSYS